MSDSPDPTKGMIEAATGLVKAVPIYQDALQPAAKQVGRALETVTKALTTALLPIEGLVWGIDKIRDFVYTRISQKLEHTPAEAVKTPDPAVAGPVLESLRYTGHHDSLRELYANLLANAIDERTASEAHPGFVEIIRNLSPDEAKVLRCLAIRGSYPLIDIRRANKKESSYTIVGKNVSLLGIDAACLHPTLVPAYIDNFLRLGLIEIPIFSHFSDRGVYEVTTQHPHIAPIIAGIIETEDIKCSIVEKRIEITPFGKQFMKACVLDKSQQR